MIIQRRENSQDCSRVCVCVCECRTQVTWAQVEYYCSGAPQCVKYSSKATATATATFISVASIANAIAIVLSLKWPMPSSLLRNSRVRRVTRQVGGQPTNQPTNKSTDRPTNQCWSFSWLIAVRCTLHPIHTYDRRHVRVFYLYSRLQTRWYLNRVDSIQRDAWGWYDWLASWLVGLIGCFALGATVFAPVFVWPTNSKTL